MIKRASELCPGDLVVSEHVLKYRDVCLAPMLVINVNAHHESASYVIFAFLQITDRDTDYITSYGSRYDSYLLLGPKD